LIRFKYPNEYLNRFEELWQYLPKEKASLQGNRSHTKRWNFERGHSLSGWLIAFDGHLKEGRTFQEI
jgi:hypothetical protein